MRWWGKLWFGSGILSNLIRSSGWAKLKDWAPREGKQHLDTSITSAPPPGGGTTEQQEGIATFTVRRPCRDHPSLALAQFSLPQAPTDPAQSLEEHLDGHSFQNLHPIPGGRPVPPSAHPSSLGRELRKRQPCQSS